MFNIKILTKLIAYISMHDIYFISCQTTFHVTINYAEADTAPFRFRVHKFIDNFHLNVNNQINENAFIFAFQFKILQKQ